MKDLALRIATALNEGGRAHLHGAPGAGKRRVIAEAAPSFPGFEIPPLAGRTVAQILRAAFASLAESLKVAEPADDAFATDPGGAFWTEAKRILESAAAPGLSIRLADDLLFAPGFLHGFRAGLVVESHPTSRIVTSSRLSPAAVAAYLASEPAIDDPAEHAIGPIEFDPDADELGEEMQELANFLGGGRGAERAAEALVTATEGHRGFCWEIAENIAKERARPSPKPAATLVTSALDRFAQDPLKFARRLCPAVFAATDSYDDDAAEIWGAPRYAGFVSDAAAAFFAEATPCAAMEGLGLFVSTESGLVPRGGPGGHAVRSALTPAVRRRIAADANLLSLREEQAAQLQDPMIEQILAAVEEELCGSAWGRAVEAELLAEMTRVVVKGFSYRVTLSHNVLDASGETRLRQVDEIAVFSGMEDADETSRGLYEREVQLLRRLASTGESALPSYRRGGELKGGGAKNFVWLQSRRIGPQLDSPRMDELREVGNGAVVAREAGRLVEALAALHEQLILHRGLMPRNVAVERLDETDFRLVLTGFEFSALARDALRTRSLSDEADATRFALLAQAREWQLRSLDECIFVAPEQQNQIREHGGFWTIEGDDGSEVKTDVFALAMLLAQLLFGPPPDDSLKSYAAAMRRADPVRNVEEAFEALLQDYRQWIEDLPEGPLTGYRSAVLRGLRAERNARPDIIAFGRAMADARTAVAARRREKRSGVYLLTYERRLMSEMLRQNVREARETWPLDERLDATVRNWTEKRLSSAERIEFVPGGPPAHVRGSSPLAHLARYAIECDRVTIFAALLFRGSTDNQDGRMLRIAFVVENRHLPKPRSPTDDDVRFPADQWELTDDSDPRRDDPSRIGDQALDWRELFTGFDTIAPVVGEALRAQEAWRFQSDLALATARFRQMPVTVWSQDGGLELGIDPVAFAAEHQNDAFYPVLREGLSAEEFFDLSLSRWLEQQEASAYDEVFFVGANGARSRLDLDFPRAGRVSVRVVSGPRPHGDGSLHFRSSRQATSAAVREQEAIRSYLAEPDKFRDLARPEPAFQADPPLPEALPQSLGGRTAEIVRNMVNADSFFALQGPPGTGKTTAIAWLVRQELKRDGSQRILLTSQSHAGVDNLLGAVTRVLAAGDDARDDLSESSLVLRILPGVNQERVPHWIREEHSIDGVLKGVLSRMNERAKKPTDRDLEREAQAQLKEAYDRGYQEIQARIERTASLVFATTAAASPSNEGLAFTPNRAQFDVAVVDEAAKAWGIDIVSPLSLAEKSVLVGDHRQLPAFDEQGVLKRLDVARRMDREPRFGPLRDEPEKTAAWLNPFRRLFAWRENAQTTPSALVIDSLDTQYRSRPEIGETVSAAFYDGKVKTAERSSWPVPPMDFARVWPELANRPPPALAWIDTSLIDGATYRERSGASKSNKGEAALLRLLISSTGLNFATFRDTEEKEGRKVDPDEFALFLAPYNAQLQQLRNELSEFGEALGVNDVNERIRTVDSSQGSEAHVVFIDLVRSQRGVDVPHFDAHPRDWSATIKGGYGFLSDPERINVMMSRAKTSLVLIGDHAHFSRLPSLIEGWARNQPSVAARDEIEERHGFWRKILDAFDPAANGIGLRLDARALLVEPQ
ncbi:MAG: AAA domain-containing protein [Pseudomonadota bacterium]